MPTAPILAGGLVAGSGLAWAMHFAFAPEPFAASSAAAIGVGIVVFTTVSVAGLLLVRAPWARRLAFASIVGATVVASATSFTAAAWFGLGAGLAAVAVLSGPWLRVWLRRRPSADGPGPQATMLALGSIAVIPLVGLADPGGLSNSMVLLALGAAVFGFGYVRARRWGLWGLRLALPVVAIAAAAAAPVAGAVAIVGVVGALTAVAWSGPAAAAVRGRTPPLPAPRPRSDSGAPS